MSFTTRPCRDEHTGIKTAVFCVYRCDRKYLSLLEYYKQDIDILERLGYKVIIATKISEFPSHCDLFVLWWWRWLWLVGPIVKMRKWTLCVTGTFDTDAYAKRPKWQKLMIKSGFRWGDLNIFVGKEMMAEAQRIGTLKRASYSPHIISDQYAVNTSVSRNPHIVFNIAHKMISNMNRKMIPELVEAFAIVLKSIPDAHLILAGEPSTGQIILETRVKELGIENAVTFLGIISFEDKINYLQSCGVYCQVSRYEGFGLAIAEAMACGAPVLVSNCGSVPEVVGDAGMYVPDLSVESIASSLLTLMTDRQLADSYGAKASDRINTCFRQTVRYEHFRSELSKLD